MQSAVIIIIFIFQVICGQCRLVVESGILVVGGADPAVTCQIFFARIVEMNLFLLSFSSLETEHGFPALLTKM